MKILLVTNNKMRWADVFRAEAFKKEWKDDEVDITNRWNLPDGDKYDIIQFLYSGALTKNKEYILKYKDKVFTSLVSQRSLDGMFDDKNDLLEIFKATQCCVCQNLGLLSQLETMGISNAVYIPNGVDEQLFNRKFVVGFVGAKDSSEHKGLHLVRKACEELNIELKVAHEHNYSHEEMPEFYKQIDCLIIPSQSEGCHNPTMEALAMNKMVLSTDVGIVRELEGIILVDRDLNTIKDALRKVSGRIQILEKYTWSKIAKQYHELYVRNYGT
jgi:glycosyltransferase involved in cell wall biosynthesis